MDRQYKYIIHSILQNFMSEIPITKLDKQEWNKKVTTTYMYSIPVEDEALPILQELVELLENIIRCGLHPIIKQQFHQYFLIHVFPPVCQKILKSRYFKSPKILQLANKILEYCVCLVINNLDLVQKYQAFAEILLSVFSTDQYYYKANNQFSDHHSFLFTYSESNQRAWIKQLKVGDDIDVLKYSHMSSKSTWSRGKIIQIRPTRLNISYLYDIDDENVIVEKDSYMIAPFLSRSINFDWRQSLKAGDLIDCQDHYGGWYNCTIMSIEERAENKKIARVAFKIYDQKGNKIDHNGRFYGLPDHYEDIDITNPKIQPFCSVLKQKNCENGIKNFSDSDDLNDTQFQYLNGERLYALPRKKHLSQFLYNLINKFGKLKGFEKPIDMLQNGFNVIFLSTYVKAISGIAPYLNKNLIKQLVERIKPIIEKHIFCETELFLKDFTKQRSEMLFSGFKILQRRIFSMQTVYEYENSKKMKLVDKCLQSEALKRKLQGLSELKDIVKSLTYSSQRNRAIKNWIKEEKIFQKIYLINSHVQLIKKSEQFFRYLINESILEVTDLERLYKIAQRGDYESRISLYKLFQEVSHIFKKPHVDFLIDTILESQLSLVLNEDIDLLNEMSKFSNYFPKDKVRTFFESIILGDNQIESLYEYATKKYCQIVAKGYEMKSHRRDIIHSFLTKLNTPQIVQVTKVLKGIFQGIGIGDYGKKELNQILAEENIDEVAILAIKNNKERTDWGNIVTQILNLLGFIYKLSYKVKIYVTTLKDIWNQLKQSQSKKCEYYKWVNELIVCEQGIGQYNELDELESYIVELFPSEKIQNLTAHQFNLIKNLFLELNKKHKFIVQISTIKQTQYRRKVEINELKLFSYLLMLIFDNSNYQIYSKSLDFFLQIYNAKENQINDINQLLATILDKMQNYKPQNNIIQIQKCLRLLSIIIDNSQKKIDNEIESLITKQNSQLAHINILNQISYVNEYIKKKQVIVPWNITLYKFKKHLSSIYNLEVNQIKLSQDRQIPDYYNSRILKEIPINFNDPISISKKYVSYSYEGQLLLNNKLNPRAIKCFTTIFYRYSQNGLMSKEKCQDFTSICLGGASKRSDQKINNLFLKYDTDQDGYLTLQNFLSFYQDAAKQNKGNTVWANLKSFGVTGDFKFSSELHKQVNPALLPRNQLSKNQKFYQTLFQFLHHNALAPLAFDHLQRLPVSKYVYEEILGIKNFEENEKIEINIEKIFEISDYYTYFYKLNVISCLTQSEKQNQKQWLKAFIESGGVESLYQKLEIFIEQYNQNNQYSTINIEIINRSLRLLYKYFIRCFGSDKILEALALLKHEADFDDKIQYLVSGFFPKADQKIIIQSVDFDLYVWKGQQKDKIVENLIRFFEKIWTEWGESTDKDHSKQFTFSTILSLICLFKINQNPQSLVKRFSTFFQKAASNKQLRQLYCLILTLCFYSENNQNYYITELFKHITLHNITSEYFKILAILVSKFGLEQQRVCEMPEILLNNILNQKNELIIEGCAKLLSNFHLDKEVAEKQVSLLWQNCLFGKDTSCKKQATRSAIYQLILKVCAYNQQVTDNVIQKILKTIETKMQSIKITYSTQVNQRATTGYVGLKNLGNICYMNSMIQQLYMNKTFRYLLLRIDDKKQPVWVSDSKERLVDDNFLHQIQRIFAFLDKSSRLDFVPSAFCVAYKPFGQSVNIMIQQDVQQFVSMFFDRLENGIKEHPLSRLIDNLYTGRYTNLFNCHECKQTKKVQQNFFSLSLEVKNSKTLAESFNRYSLGELINDYNCDFCHQKADVSKKTRISKAPQILILHLQRIVFNLDTFINQKITSKHQFPTQFNLYPYSLQYYEKQQLNQPNLSKQHEQYQYELTGIICHIGNAEMGHYMSYIKNQSGKWFDFNDSMVTSFNPSNIQAQCFGGSFTYEDQYDWEKRQNSKSAYLLIYQKVCANKIQMIVKSRQQKEVLLSSLRLKEIVQISQQVKVEEEPTESQEQSSSAIEDSQKQQQMKLKIQMQQIQMIRKHKSEDNIDVECKDSKNLQKNGQIVVKIKDEIDEYISHELQLQIQSDNEAHFFQKCLASASFSKFFAKILILPHNNSQSMVKLCQKLTFGFWLKSSSFKQLLFSLAHYIKTYPLGLKQIITQNSNLVPLLIQNSQIQVRTNIAIFLADSFGYFIADRKLSLLEDDQDSQNKLILTFLNNLFDQIPTTVSKCWTKFNQYFQFWYELSKKSQRQILYMIRKQFLKHFIDYFLDKKSPLKIYINKPTIGSSYANPNYSMLLKTVQNLLQYYIINKIQLNSDERKILINYEFIEKLIHESYQTVASKIVKIICPNNLYASQKIAIVLLKGINKSNYESIQPYLDVLHEYLLIDDDFLMFRIEWVLGKQTLLLSTISKTLSAMNGYSLEDRIYQFPSGLHIEGGSTLLQPIFTQNRRTQNLCMLSLQQLLKLCQQRKIIRHYIFSLGPPNYLYAHYVDFFDQFIHRYTEQARRTYGYSQASTGFNKQELGKNVKKLHQNCLEKFKNQLAQEQTLKITENNNILNNQQTQIVANQILIQKQEYLNTNNEKVENTKQVENNENEQKGCFVKKDSYEQQQKIDQQYQEQDRFDNNFSDDGLGQYCKSKSQDSQNQYLIKKESKDSSDIGIYDGQYLMKRTSKDSDYYASSNQQIKITVQQSPSPNKSNDYSDKENMHYIDEEDKKYSQDPIKEQVGDNHHAYHPVKFIYRLVEHLESGLDNVSIEQHQSELIEVRTYPTGTTNKIFTSNYHHKKVSERLSQNAWQYQRKQTVKGYFVTNSKKISIRVQTEDGCYAVRSHDSTWIWSNEIIKIWIPEKFQQWPQWSLFADPTPIQIQKQIEIDQDYSLD